MADGRLLGLFEVCGISSLINRSYLLDASHYRFLLYGSTQVLLVRVRVRPEHDRAQSCAIALRSPASERPSDVNDIHQIFTQVLVHTRCAGGARAAAVAGHTYIGKLNATLKSLFI